VSFLPNSGEHGLETAEASAFCDTVLGGFCPATWPFLVVDSPQHRSNRSASDVAAAIRTSFQGLPMPHQGVHLDPHFLFF
jgi:hypothetical protein